MRTTGVCGAVAREGTIPLRKPPDVGRSTRLTPDVRRPQRPTLADGTPVERRNVFVPPARPPAMGIEEDDVAPARFLEDVEMRVGEIVSAEPFPEARTSVYKLVVDVGSERLQSAAGLTDNYRPDELVGRQVVAVVNLGTVVIAGFESQCLVTGVDGESGVVHLQPEREVENGTRVY